MTGSFDLPAAWLLNYLLLVFRCLGLVVFVPLPGAQNAPAPARILFALLVAGALAPLASTGPGAQALASPAASWELLRWIAAESALGAAFGCVLRLALEAFGLAAQALGFQAGYSYVNSVDPTSQVDASILSVALALLANLLFFAFDLHLLVVRTLAATAEAWPLGSFAPLPGHGEAAIRLGGHLFDAAVRLALPTIAVLLLVDLTLGLLNQAQPKLQLLQLAFPIKIVGGVAVLIPTLALAPKVFEFVFERAGEMLVALAAR